ncbi:hypothetical protein V6N11_032014 [Hibiscus sabdariffa]|uniref:Uncharacterized protein n=1 Tax=Hibiscus sabdariffa TaxID=183260 RepID=A0ABR2T045_9ROSI
MTDHSHHQEKERSSSINQLRKALKQLDGNPSRIPDKSQNTGNPKFTLHRFPHLSTKQCSNSKWLPATHASGVNSKAASNLEETSRADKRIPGKLSIHEASNFHCYNLMNDNRRTDLSGIPRLRIKESINKSLSS